ncbi:hypothetical protein EMA8858_02609 [Emticicia aquatica]|uniref:MFS transporter n=1 Tax=Emticicia aquatica TaxID=1681835 RepID=A0ABM9ARC4_9BACT|nr:DUF5690 family protein [Emticicia aquatica]CAH0996477.1 hypothetical protein EMA8858_02609 [Emticicia aquatica]
MKYTLKTLLQKQSFLIIWCIIAAFGTYFCMYAFRKPFNTGLYEGYELFGLSYKTVLIITQVLGYMLSKVLGIKIISELRANQRIALIISLILISEIALILFGLIPYSYNWICMLFNGLPLGMVWGVIFCFLEGRRITEFIAIGLSINLVMGSGILKTIYLTISSLMQISEFWMPAFIGLIFLPIFLFFVWMLAKIPPPNAEDLQVRNKRNPMNKSGKNKLLQEFSWGFWAIALVYVMLTMIRDFRDNFSVEIWRSLHVNFDKNTFAQSEMLIGFFVLILLASVGFIKENDKAFAYIQLLILLGIMACGLSTWFFQQGALSAYNWMILLGISFFLPYLLIQTLYFERFIAVFKLNANAGFFVYICDSMGYLGSVLLMMYREFFMKELSWVNVLVNLGYGIFTLSFVLWGISVWFFIRKLNTKIEVAV